MSSSEERHWSFWYLIPMATNMLSAPRNMLYYDWLPSASSNHPTHRYSPQIAAAPPVVSQTVSQWMLRRILLGILSWTSLASIHRRCKPGDPNCPLARNSNFLPLPALLFHVHLLIHWTTLPQSGQFSTTSPFFGWFYPKIHSKSPGSTAIRFKLRHTKIAWVRRLK